MMNDTDDAVRAAAGRAAAWVESLRSRKEAETSERLRKEAEAAKADALEQKRIALKEKKRAEEESHMAWQKMKEAEIAKFEVQNYIEASKTTKNELSKKKEKAEEARFE